MSLIDRLESKGFAERRPHDGDKRRVLVAARSEAAFAAMAPLFEGFVRSLEELCERFSDEELAVIASFMTEAAARQRDATERLALDHPPGDRGR